MVQMLRSWEFQIQLDEKSDKAIYLQIADAVISDIQSGRLKAGDALPGSRSLAQGLKVNRNTVVEALNVLIIEGWLVSRERRGTFVSDMLPMVKEAEPEDRRLAAIGKSVGKQYRIELDDGHPDSKIAPIAELARAYRQIFNLKARWKMMGYGCELGDEVFRTEIARMLNHQRGMQTDEHFICITRGSQMAMYLTAHCLFRQGDYVMVENPGYKPAWTSFEKAGATLLPIAVDKHGLIIEDVVEQLKTKKGIKAIYVTPHRQYPTTVTLSLKRRLELVRLSNEYGFTIIEDDYDNEFHFGYRPVLPLSSFPELRRYVYIGTMSKVVAPALRIGYMATNDASLIGQVGELRKIIDVQGDSIMEQAVLQLIKDGTIKRHLKKATHYYKAKRDFTASLLKKHLDKIATFSIPDGGLAFWISPVKEVDWLEIAELLRVKGIRIATRDHYSSGTYVNGFRLGYGSLSESELQEAVSALAALL